MKVANTRKVNDRVRDYLETQELNFLIGKNISAHVTDGIVFSNRTVIMQMAESIKGQFDHMEPRLDEDGLLLLSMMVCILEEKAKDIKSVPLQALYLTALNGVVFHKGELEEDEYYSKVYPKEGRNDKYELGERTYQKYELFHYGSQAVTDDGVQVPSIGTCDHRYRYPCVYEGGRVADAVTPDRFFTMNRGIMLSHGKTLCLGCGMGYFAYMASLKDDVESVTIVEKDPDLLNLFEVYILPKFEHMEKIKTVNADPADFVAGIHDGDYDFCFAAAWKSNLDAMEYLKMKEALRPFKNMDKVYWLEEAIALSLLEHVFLVIFEESGKNQGIAVEKPKDMLPDEEYKLSYIRSLLENEEIKTAEDVDKYMDYTHLIEMLD